ncbi:hypothetical protein TREAZ_2747 [Leadbettera azotonutricia ZAS-9]|uniref:Uncharacterized protein n=1 Tax=Leadbettera azotonutricia (strain ATCC BAA-888 / DSM 13862 / ZAS-9) TaxID=545695 RepID=F5YD66_LEAAZ|nr:hypothetical protein TREAZ_2747 [Leadbettera azotonutricia ZAS-9]
MGAITPNQVRNLNHENLLCINKNLTLAQGMLIKGHKK